MKRIARSRRVATTAGNVVMSGELTGDFTVFDAQTGAVRYRFNTGGPIGGGIVTYAVGGKQYIAVATGHGSYVGRALADHYHKDKIINMKESAAVVVFSLD